MGVQFPEKYRYVTLEWPHRRMRWGSGGQLTPQFGQIYDIYSGKKQHICLTNCVTPKGTSIHLPEIHFGWGNKGDVHRVGPTSLRP